MDKRIDVYIDINNSHNVWGMIHSKGLLPRKEDEFIRFDNYYAMNQYVNSNFSHDNISYHYIDYSNIIYYFYNGHPELNYVEIRYNEKEREKFKEKKIKLPPEFENVFIDILKTNKRIPKYASLDSRYYHDVDVYEEEAINRKETVRSIKMSLNEFFALSGDKIKKIVSNKDLVRKLKIVMATSSFAILLTCGYKLIKDNEFNSEFLIQKDPIRNTQDIGIYVGKGKAGIIIDKLMSGEYSEVSADDIKSVIEFLHNVEASNYDKNSSHNTLDFSNYFDYKLMTNGNYSNTAYEVLERIGKLYNKCFMLDNGTYELNKDNVKKYLDYVVSLTCVYDTYHDTRPSALSFDNQSVMSPYATSDMIKAYDSYPPILRYIILNQLRAMLIRSDYKMDKLPSYSFDFDGVDKYDIVSILDKNMERVTNELYLDCCKKDENKAI